MGRRERRRATRRQEVVDAAFEIAASEGLERLTIARLAERVDAAVGALYRYFPSKEALLTALQVEAVGELERALAQQVHAVAAAGRAWAPDSAAPTVAALATAAAVPLAYVAEAARAPARRALIGASLAAPRPVLEEPQALEVDRALAPILALATRQLEAAVIAGALEPGDPAQRTAMAWAATQGLTSFFNRDRLQPPPLRVAALAGPLLESLLRGWGAPADAARAGVQLASEVISAPG